MKENSNMKEGNNKNITNYFYGTVQNYVNGDYHTHGNISNSISGETQPAVSEDRMCQAVEHAMGKGLWYASTAWAVVYRIYQIKGYNGSISQFVRDVRNWPFKTKPLNWCTDDSVSKPLRSGKFSGHPYSWKANGAADQTVVLATSLLEEITGFSDSQQ